MRNFEKNRVAKYIDCVLAVNVVFEGKPEYSVTLLA